MVDLKIASLVECTESEGIGKRFAIWTQGCSFRCPGCCNPHLWTDKGGKIFSVEELFQQIVKAQEKYQIEGITFVGGEPLEQTAGVTELSRKCQQIGLSVMIFTGFLLEDLKKTNSPILQHADVIVDGLYVEALRTTTRRFIGSTNQKMYFLTDFYSPDDPRWFEPNTAEIIYNSNKQIQVVGFPFESVLRTFGPKKNNTVD